jgi:hypothetical protein
MATENVSWAPPAGYEFSGPQTARNAAARGAARGAILHSRDKRDQAASYAAFISTFMVPSWGCVILASLSGQLQRGTAMSRPHFCFALVGLVSRSFSREISQL